MAAPFDSLSPDLVAEAVEEAFGLSLDGLWVPYPSYVNRVWGLRSEEGLNLVVKFYRPGRWTPAAIREEHAFLADLASQEIPVAAPIPAPDGDTLPELALETEDGSEILYPFALFPKRGGRGFDAESEEDWLRLGRLAGRVHDVGAQKPARERITLGPGRLAAYAEVLRASDLVHPECRREFADACREAERILDPLLAETRLQRIHGDFHRGNVLDRPDDGLMLIDFDDMAMGPSVQDLWLLLPGSAEESGRELAWLLEGYEEFRSFDRLELRLIEPLRFLRMVHFLAWQARQRFDSGFARFFPDWGSRAFWIKETEDLKDQLTRMTS